MFILIATVTIVAIGVIVGAGLVYTGKKFYVPVDEREAAVRECLPGNNCGACGYAGCDAMAAAIVAPPPQKRLCRPMPASFYFELLSQKIIIMIPVLKS